MEINDLNVVIPGLGTALDFLGKFGSPDNSKNWNMNDWAYYFESGDKNNNPLGNHLVFLRNNPEWIRQVQWGPLPTGQPQYSIDQRVAIIRARYAGTEFVGTLETLLQYNKYTSAPTASTAINKAIGTVKEAGMGKIFGTLLIIGAAIWALIAAFGKKGKRGIYGCLILFFAMASNAQVSNNGVKQLQVNWNASGGVQSILNKPDIAKYQDTAKKGQPNGYAPLNSSSKIPAGYMPALNYTSTYVRGSMSAMLATGASAGDICIRTDSAGLVLLLAYAPATDRSNWVRPNLVAEADPIFTVHPAFGITGANISNWNSSYGWGNHALGGYFKADGSLPLNGNLIVNGGGNSKFRGNVQLLAGNSLCLDSANNVVLREISGISLGVLLSGDTILSVVSSGVLIKGNSFSNSFIKYGGTQYQSLQADGSVKQMKGGTYQPYGTASFNCSALTYSRATWMDVDSLTHLNFQVSGSTTGGSQFQFSLAIPTGSAFSAGSVCYGTASSEAVPSGTYSGCVVAPQNGQPYVLVTCNNVSGTAGFSVFGTVTYKRL